MNKKLLTEFVGEDIRTVRGSTATSGGEYLIEGIFLQANVKNHNNRLYPKEILDKSVRQYIDEQVRSGRAVGELSHPDTLNVNLDRVSHKITRLEWDGDDLHGTATILDTPCGRIVKNLIDANVKLGVSSRGVGSVTEQNNCEYVQDDFELRAIDIVQNPSAPDSFVTANIISEEIDNLTAQNRLNEQRDTVAKIKTMMQIEKLKKLLKQV